LQKLFTHKLSDNLTNLTGTVFLEALEEDKYKVCVKFNLFDSDNEHNDWSNPDKTQPIKDIEVQFSANKLSKLYTSLLRFYDHQTVLEQNHQFTLRVNDNKEIDSISSTKNPTLDVLFMNEVSTENMRDYQREGIGWLVNQNVAVLADDMGLGKTVQAIKAMDIHFREGNITKCIIVCPVSLIKNWENEIKKWAPHLVFNRFTSKTKDVDLIKLLAV